MSHLEELAVAIIRKVDAAKEDRPALEALLLSIEEAERNIDAAMEDGTQAMYDYGTEKPKLFTDQGQRMLLRVRDQAFDLIRKAGAVRLQEATSGCCGDSWVQLACLDRLVELGDLREIPQKDAPGPHRIFVSARLDF